MFYESLNFSCYFMCLIHLGAITEAESIFTYSNVGTDTFDGHNPTSTSPPPFLEDLLDSYDGTDYLNTIKANCTDNGVIQRTCVFDYLVTNKSSVASSSLGTQQSSSQQKILAGYKASFKNFT